ncbi:MAG: FAD-dependent oxidoreductase [Bacteroidota bacterium]
MKKIVIVGGGVAGKSLASHLIKSKAPAEIALVDPKEYFEVPYAQLRALVLPESFGPKIRKSYRDLLPEVNHIQGKAVGLSDTAVELEGGVTVPMDYLVLATGSSFKQWELLKGREISLAERQASFVAEGKRLAAAASILVIGGGPIGVEFAGDVAAKYREKKVILAHSGARLLDSLSTKMSRRAEKVLTGLGVELHLNSYVTQSSPGIWTSKSGQQFSADLVYLAVGIDVNGEWIGKESGIAKTDRHAVQVDAYLRVPGRPNIFAIGDLNDVPEIKMGAFADKQAKLTAKNLIALLNDPNATLKAYKPSAPMSMVTIGMKKGAVQLPFGHPHFLISMKQKDLFAARTLGG